MAKVSLSLTLVIALLSLLGGYLIGAKIEAEAESQGQPEKMPEDTTQLPESSDQDLIALLLRENLGERRFPFCDVIKFSTGKVVIPFDPSHDPHKALKTVIESAAQHSITQLSRASSPTKGLSRINEASRYFEDMLLTSINQDPQFHCSIPKNAKGKEQRSGYPDLIITHLDSGAMAYLDPKLYQAGSENSSFRTFYYEPKINTTKIHHDAIHFLLGIQHDGNDGDWQFTDIQLADISALPLRLKAEFQSSNKELYQQNLLVK